MVGEPLEQFQRAEELFVELHVFGGLINFEKNDEGKANAKRNNKGQPKLTIGGVSTKFKRMAEVYKTFAEPWLHTHDFSDDALIALFNNESYGTPVDESKNGFSLGKSG